MTSADHTSSARALEKADQYIHSSATQEGTRTSQDRMLINRTQSTKPEGGCVSRSAEEGVPVGGGVSADPSQAAFLRSLEEDAQERAERRKEREERGKEAKKKGNKAFKEGDFGSAVQCFTDGIQQAPWDITLYTNRALVSWTSQLDGFKGPEM